MKGVFEMLLTYPAIFHEAEEGGFWIEFPEFLGATQGDTLDEAMVMSKEFLAAILASYIDDEKELPKPSDIKNLKIDDGFTSLIQADPAPFIRGNKTIRKNVSVPEWLVKRAKKEKVNFSQVLTDALMKRFQ
ncbi:MAG: type II toxin-antitoxin system HicB family antitoxin [Clostridiales bacterium]|nr:type II toxin-antitoxin system HicB family antitoxin [Clostridiales bacterium]